MPNKLDEQYVFLYSIRDCTGEQFPKVVEFIKKYFNYELITVFTKIWFGDNAKKAIFVDSMQNQSEMEK